MSKYDELKQLAEAVRQDNATYGDADMYEPTIGLSRIEAEFSKHANPAAILSLIAEVGRLEQWKKESGDVMRPVLDYAHSLKIAELGKSVTQALIEDHKRLTAENERIRVDNSSLRGSCKALGDESKHLARRVRALHRAVTWLASTGWGVKRPVWLERILAKEAANG